MFAAFEWTACQTSPAITAINPNFWSYVSQESFQDIGSGDYVEGYLTGDDGEQKVSSIAFIHFWTIYSAETEDTVCLQISTVSSFETNEQIPELSAGTDSESKLEESRGSFYFDNNRIQANYNLFNCGHSTNDYTLVSHNR